MMKIVTMMAGKHRVLFTLLGLCVVTLAYRVSLGDSDALRRIVQEQCLPHWLEANNSSPCVRIKISDAAEFSRGSAVLHDRKGGAHFLLIPTDTVSGIESPDVLAPAANYFADAWQARDVIEGAAGYPLSRAAIGMAVNRRSARSQNQLHIHMECLRPQVAEALRTVAEALRGGWSAIDIGGSTYLALRVTGDELTVNPFVLLAEGIPEAKADMGAYTLIVAGMEYQAGPGFALLAASAAPSGERLLDSTCEVARPSTAAYQDRSD